jgi:hypothetical protein
MKSKSYVGINIQYPISRLILEGSKTIETRTYPIPKNYIGQEMALVETPGKEGGFKSRVVAIIKFGSSFKYESKSKFYLDTYRHCVTPDSQWAWDPKKEKWGWSVLEVRALKKPIPITKRIGIKYTKDLLLKI